VLNSVQHSHAIGCFWAVATVCSIKDELKVRCLIPIGRMRSVQYYHATGGFRAEENACSIKDELKVMYLLDTCRLILHGAGSAAKRMSARGSVVSIAIFEGSH
jgi:hypothetical protein